MTRQVSLTALTLLVSFVTAACGDDDSPTATKSVKSIASVTINEVMSKNSTYLSDTGKKSDWLEFYNDGSTDVSLEGYFISDDKNALLKADLPAAAVVPAKGHLVIWLDGTTDLESPLHFPFKLSGEGENFYISNAEAQVVKKLTIPADPTGTNATAPDVSYGAYPDGASTMGWCRTPTPKEANSEDCTPGNDAGL
jgi:hypothetical protein